MNKNNTNPNPNAIAGVYIYRNMLDALLGDDGDFIIFEVNEPLPDGTIEKRPDGFTLNIMSSSVNKLVILQDKLGEYVELDQKLYLDYYYDDSEGRFEYVNLNKNFKGLTEPGTNLDIALLFDGNPHFSRFYSNWSQMGPIWCVVFKPELIQYFNDDGNSLSGRRSCAMEDIARVIFPRMGHYKIYFSTENVECV